MLTQFQYENDHDDKSNSIRTNRMMQDNNTNKNGISVTKLTKTTDGQIIVNRETIKSTIFGSSIAPPTMSLEEFGDIQLREAIEREQRSQEYANSSENVKGLKALEEEGLEDNQDLIEKATIKDRAWDDWKDHNPRGWGNKLNKRY